MVRFFCKLTIFIVLVWIISMSLMVEASQRDDLHKYKAIYKLIALKDRISKENLGMVGGILPIFLGSLASNDVMYFVFATEGARRDIRVRKVRCDLCTVYETDKAPHARAWVCVGFTRWKLYVPKGTVTRSFQVNLE